MPEYETASFEDDHNDRSSRLTNDDFRRLLMTPRASMPSTTPSLSIPVSGNRDRDGPKSTISMAPPPSESEDKAERRRKKKSFYAKLKKQEEDKMAELAEKYRDRAKERREGANPDYQAEDPLSGASGYRAVAPDVKSGLDAAERRRQMIQESKFLGGDMEHTHLVKGLDYALLQKVRSEITLRENEEEEQMEKLVEVAPVVKEKKKKPKEEVEEMQFKTRLGRNIYRTAIGSKTIERNELFAPGRMAYCIDLDDELADSDIPTTLIRSKADVPHLEQAATLTTNDIVINKLAQILSYLRQGARHGKKGKRKEKGKEKGGKPADDSIYGDIGDYAPAVNKEKEREKDREKDRDRGERDRDREREKERDRGKGRDKERKRGSYFEKPEEEPVRSGWDAVKTKVDSSSKKDRGREGEVNNPQVAGASKATAQLLSKLAAEPEGYAECYPGLDEMHDAIEDSDDEVDYTKMDLGNKKGPIGRWDFDTQEEYSQYMNNKEALPKAAFQYGVKMADGRRTRTKNKEKNEKQQLDREWNKIQNIIQKRKAPAGGGRETGVGFKVPRY